MSDLSTTAEQNVQKFRYDLRSKLNDVIPNAPEVTALIECLILAHIQKYVASMMEIVS